MGIGDTGRTEVLHTGARTWIKPDENLWATMASQQGHPQAAAAIVQLFKGHYLTGPADDDLQGAVGMCSLIKGITEEKDDGGGTYAKGSAGTVNGTKSLSIVATGPDGETSTLYVAAEGEPYLLRTEQTQGSEPGQLTFSGFKEPLTVQAPPSDLVIDVSVVTDQLTTA
ncbi:hypothetical protein ACFV4M_02460 [Kitasatospora indigofera]|uniref:hypothetical protein n=1 Tax=Kitasatospora indigofera TaxID=67307 RepID=UPI00364E5508